MGNTTKELHFSCTKPGNIRGGYRPPCTFNHYCTEGKLIASVSEAGEKSASLVKLTLENQHYGNTRDKAQ